MAIVKDRLGDVLLSTITRETIEGFQAKRKLDRVSNLTVNMDVGALRKVLKRYGHWRRLQDHITILSEVEGAPIGRALTNEEQKRLLETAAGNPEWEHVYCAAVLAANTSMRGVEVRHVRRKDVDLDKAWDVESATGKGVLHVGHSKNETSKRRIPLNGAVRDAITRMLKRAEELRHTEPGHYLWCASQHHHYDPTKPGKKWDGAWRSLREAAGLPGFRFHDLRQHATRHSLRLQLVRKTPGRSVDGELPLRVQPCTNTGASSGSAPATGFSSSLPNGSAIVAGAPRMADSPSKTSDSGLLRSGETTGSPRQQPS